MKAKAIIPQLTYYNTKNAIEWLCSAFGFDKHLVITDETGEISHVELILSNHVIMIGSADAEGELSNYIKHPYDTKGMVTQSPYIILDSESIKPHFERAKKQGAKILHELREENYGGIHYSCYDIEGHLWSFGTYDPWNANAPYRENG